MLQEVGLWLRNGLRFSKCSNLEIVRMKLLMTHLDPDKGRGTNYGTNGIKNDFPIFESEKE